MPGLLAFIVKRLLAMIVIIWIVATVVFFLEHLSPDDPLISALPQNHSNPIIIHALRHQFHLDQPLLVQYKYFLSDYSHGNFGVSLEQGLWMQPVWQVLKDGLPNSLKLGGYSLFIALLVALPVGLLSALKQNTWIDHVSQTTMMVLFALPSFVIAPFAQLFLGADLHWLPVYGWGDPGIQGIKEMIMPVGIFATQIAGYFAKSFRSFVLEVMRQDYIRTARAKGLKERVVIYLHVVKNTLLPLASIVGPSIAFLVTGAFVIENYFSIPGIGYATVNSVVSADYPIIQATTILIAIAVVVINAMTDIFYAMIDPRVRL